MAKITRAIDDSGSDSVQNKIAARQLIENPGAVIQTISEMGGDWLRVMNNIKDWVQMVSFTLFSFSKFVIIYKRYKFIMFYYLQIVAHLGGG